MTSCINSTVRRTTARVIASIATIASVVAAEGCASLGQLKGIVQPPRFEEAGDRSAEVHLVGPAIDRPVGGASIRLWTRVTNPNPFGLTLSTVRATLMLEGSRAATGEFPLGLPLTAGASTVVPLDLSVNFTDLPGLATAVRRAIDGRPVGYQLEGTVGVDVGPLGQPTFGPMPLASGQLRVGPSSTR